MATVTAGYNWVSGETVTPAKLNSAAAPTVVVADNEITTAKILDANVTAEKLASNAVETAKIADDAVTNDKLSLAANAGEIKKAINADNDAPIYACRAWVNFDGTAGSNVGGEFRCTIRSNGNVTKVVRNAPGSYSVFYTTGVPANACAVGSAHETTGSGIGNVNQWVSTHPVSTAQCNVFIVDISNVGQNTNVVSVAVFA